jgi:hypothetical protein
MRNTLHEIRDTILNKLQFTLDVSLPAFLSGAPRYPLHPLRSILYPVSCILSPFLTNKPNSPIVQIYLTYLSAMNYVVYAGLMKVKNKPNSNPFKANFGPKIRVANPIQTQFKANLHRFSLPGKLREITESWDICPFHTDVQKV